MIKRTKKVLPYIVGYAKKLLEGYKKYHGYSDFMDKICREDEAILRGLIADPEGAKSKFHGIDFYATHDFPVPAIGYEPEHHEFSMLRSNLRGLAGGSIPKEISFLQKEVPTDLSAIKKEFDKIINEIAPLLPEKPIKNKTTLWMFRECYALGKNQRTRDLTRVYVEFAKHLLKFWYQEIDIRFICRGYDIYGEACEATYYNSDDRNPKEDQVYIRDPIIGDVWDLEIKPKDVLLFMGYGWELAFESNRRKITRDVSRIAGYTPLYAYTEIENGFHETVWELHEELKAEKYPDLIMTYMSEVEHALDWMVPLAEKLNKTLIR